MPLNIIRSNNAKLKGHKGLYTFSMPAGHACPFAKECLSKADKKTGKITDGKQMQFRCFGAMLEARFGTMRESVWNNFELLKEAGFRNTGELKKLIRWSMPKGVKILRMHTTGGDFISKAYMRAWMEVAADNPKILFYGYTKATKHLVALRDGFPSNFRLTASRGGTQDSLIDKHDLIEARVVFSLEEAKELGLKIDHDDKLAMACKKSFALLIHGSQPAGSEAANAMKQLKSKGVKHSYSHKKTAYSVA